MKEKAIEISKWLIMSSSDPAKYSATIKGLGLGVIPVIIAISGLTGVKFDSDTLTGIVNVTASLVQIFFTLVATTWSLFGLLRKAYLTYMGENHQTK